MGVFGHFRPYGPPANRATSRSSTPRHAASLGRRRRRSRAMEGFVTVFFWQHDLDPAFPLSVLEYETRDADDQMHWHEYLEIALCLQGGGQFLFGRRSYPAEPGDVFLIDDAEPHVGVSDPPDRMRLLLTLCRPELIAAPGCRSFDTDYLPPFRCGGRPFANRLPGGGAAASEVRPILLELKGIWDREEPADRHLLDANLRRVLAVLVRHARVHESAPDGAAAPSGADSCTRACRTRTASTRRRFASRRCRSAGSSRSQIPLSSRRIGRTSEAAAPPPGRRLAKGRPPHLKGER